MNEPNLKHLQLLAEKTPSNGMISNIGGDILTFNLQT